MVDTESALPSEESLEQLFSDLKSLNFQESQSQPLFAARYWNLSLERESRRRWSANLSNVSEVAIPRWYWRGLNADSLARIQRLSLGKTTPDVTGLASEACLFSRSNPGQQLWLVIPRFNRLILANHRSVVDHNYVYFGDDTLFLMSEARDSLAILESSSNGSGIRFLDLCCGGGGVGMSLPSFVGSVVGVDLNERAILAARRVAKIQGLQNYQYHFADAHEVLEENFDLIVGNPPTLDPKLAGADVFHATGSLGLFESLLKGVLASLSTEGRAILTVFSQTRVHNGVVIDPTFKLVEELVGPTRPFQYRVRRKFPLKASALCHCSVHIFGCSESIDDNFLPASWALQLPGLPWRRG